MQEYNTIIGNLLKRVRKNPKSVRRLRLEQFCNCVEHTIAKLPLNAAEQENDMQKQERLCLSFPQFLRFYAPDLRCVYFVRLACIYPRNNPHLLAGCAGFRNGLPRRFSSLRTERSGVRQSRKTARN